VKKAAYFLLVALFLLSFPSSDGAEAKMVITKTEHLNVREGPGTSYPIKKKLNKGEIYTVAQEKNDWVQLKLSTTETGWVSRQYVADMNENMQATVDRLRVRSAPSSQASIIGYLKLGQTVEVLDTNSHWTKIKSGTLTGWVSSDYLASATGSGTTSIQSKSGTVAVDVLNVRTKPSQQATILGKITFGQQVRIINETADWYQIESPGSMTGWVYRTYIMTATLYITVLEDGTNIRSKPSLQSQIQATAKRGQQYRVIAKEGSWYKIELSHQKSGYIADWVVAVVRNAGNTGTIKNKTIVIDPGHGGKDSGTIGSGGMMEKTMTLKTAQMLKNQLQAAGATVILTRKDDTYLSLAERVSMAEQHKADAFVSIHYDSSPDGTARGMTIYYYHSLNDYPLALSFDPFLSQSLPIPYRGVRFGDFHVLRETSMPSVLFELGYLNNAQELSIIASDSYQKQVTKAIVAGLQRYFSN
jgi:N-acetylmuramoyl-L-alanine amidase